MALPDMPIHGIEIHGLTQAVEQQPTAHHLARRDLILSLHLRISSLPWPGVL
ncbi:hypothetical protein MAV3388_22650 [Mycobacterium avium subsp. hominissuis 3388]|nr:hypothetical protein D522_21171 [Mycobacterium avium subsp. paratuberculosis S5]KDO92605.1 hypothetical protein MAV3388_22650 [Mycobacterium avium subsp. hominissuis 3388]KDP01576.1 hypothetical protein MAV100_23580 [Mycobacterium avium subsp. hominissuis 100]